MIKTFHTRRFNEVVAGCPAPIFALGAAKLPTPLDALRLAAREIADGAQGVVFGRNALQVERPIQFQAALIDVVRHGNAPEAALAAAGA
jgi:DhnA family fructose-bisphosphate aldolase class Ia